jgi:hypothetical protein
VAPSTQLSPGKPILKLSEDHGGRKRCWTLYQGYPTSDMDKILPQCTSETTSVSQPLSEQSGPHIVALSAQDAKVVV